MSTTPYTHYSTHNGHEVHKVDNTIHCNEARWRGNTNNPGALIRNRYYHDLWAQVDYYGKFQLLVESPQDQLKWKKSQIGSACSSTQDIQNLGQSGWPSSSCYIVCGAVTMWLCGKGLNLCMHLHKNVFTSENNDLGRYLEFTEQGYIKNLIYCSLHILGGFVLKSWKCS